MIDKIDIDDLFDRYYRWMKSSYNISEVDNSFYEINTPFLDTLSDNLRYFLSGNGNTITLDDDGETIENLEMMGVSLKKGQRNEELKSILRQFEIDLDEDNVLSVNGSISKFPQLQQNLVSAMMKIDELSILKRKNVINLFYDEIYSYFDANALSGKRDYPIIGKSGIKYKIDYFIDNNNRSKALDFKNRLTFKDFTESDYKFKDIKDNGNNASSIIIYNENEKKLTSDLINAAKYSGIELLPFQNKDRLLEVVKS